MPTVQEIAQDIYSRAKSKGVDPNLALGIALREGLNKNTIGSPSFGNRDAKGYSYGPWQLYSGSPVAGSVAPGGQAAAFARQYGQVPNAQNWRQQNEFALNLMKRLTPQQQLTTWYAIRDNGGHQAISRIGLQNALRMGLSPDAVASAVTPASTATPTIPASSMPAPTTQAATGGMTPPLDLEMPPPPPMDGADDYAPMMAMMGDEGGASGDMTDLSDMNQMPASDFEMADASAGMSDLIHQKAAMGKQRRAEMATPLGQLFTVETIGQAGKGYA